MKRALAWLLTPPFVLIFASTVVVWHPLIVLSYYLGPRIYRSVIALGNGLLLLELKILGTRIEVSGLGHVPRDTPAVIVSNHQSLLDIPLLLWTLRAFDPCFIAKKELGKNIPSISHALRNMGSALIDRSDALAAVTTIEDFGRQVHQDKRAAVIFPEGTRARNGRLRPFKTQGVLALLRTMPGATVIPTSISGSWRLTEHNFMPVPVGIVIKVTFHKPVVASEEESLPRKVEAIIEQDLPPEERRPASTRAGEAAF